ncbi:PH domain-containing protein [Xylanimonas sp. McL0601]|uniref:PH domain-containing protein n=1 Tax=Xylanimonas sp. McL0601 TaxID=3414739 RepID=UPI003CF1D0CE
MSTPGTRTPVPADEQLEWRRLHPVTPLVRGWTVVAIALAFLGQQTLEQVNQASEVADVVSGLWWKLLLGLAALTTFAFCYTWLAWRMTTYAVGDDDVHMRKGVVFRQQRHARLDRLQAVDIRQPVLARLFGLAELTLEVAGGSGSAIAIGFLREEEARRLRADLLARAAGVRSHPARAPLSEAGEPLHAPPADGTTPSAGLSDAGEHSASRVSAEAAVGEAPEEEVYAVPPGRLVVSLLRSPGIWAVVLALIGVAVSVAITREFSILASALPVILGAGGYVFNRFAGEFGFRAALSPDGVRLRHGLLETRAQTIPPGRVQAVSMTQGPLWRGPDWWRVRVNVAGYQQNDSSQAQSVLLPVGTRAEALTALWLVLPDLGTADPLGLLDEGLTGMVPADGSASPGLFTNAPRRARYVDPIAWRRDAFAVTEQALLVRRGRIVRRLDVVPHARMQSVAVEQGPLQRRLGVASFAVHSTPGVVTPVVPHLDAADAARLLGEQAARARAARAHAGPERWMERPTTSPGPDLEPVSQPAPTTLDPGA